MKILIFILLVLIGCGEIEEYPKEIDPIGSKDEEPTFTPVPEFPRMNPICDGVQRFSGGNVWKPAGDETRSPVMIIKQDFYLPFQCRVLLEDGTFREMRYTGFANGDRQHHRVDDARNPIRDGKGFKDCEDIAGRALGGVVECRDENQICTWAMHRDPCRRKD